eukprot:GGOE01018393.1.p1 GENE.GGOE01018393.1~~GGOE01018393.1.p1  ORF type:complete len:1066 (-),score=251.82 GGOE01018393.1:100-3111(-)
MPHFQRVDVDVGRDWQLLRYHLYHYIELSVPEQPVARHQPVLYVPGNAGHFRQIRSLGGHTLRATAQSLTRCVFFTIDFREELSAAHAQIALDQALFLNYCLRTVLALPGSRASVIVVAHSIGGVLSRVAPLLRNYPPQGISSLITLSSPHRGLPITMDLSVAHLFRRLNLATEACAPPLANISILSISGGLRDNQVKPHYSSLDGLGRCPQLSVTTYMVEGIAISADHLCVMWCNQVMAKLSTTLGALALADTGLGSHTHRTLLLRTLWQERTASRLGFHPADGHPVPHYRYSVDRPPDRIASQANPRTAEGPVTLVHSEEKGTHSVMYTFGVHQFFAEGLDAFFFAANVPPTAVRLFGKNATTTSPVLLAVRPQTSEHPVSGDLLWRVAPQTVPDGCVQLPHGSVDERHDPVAQSPYPFHATACYAAAASLPGIATLLVEVQAKVPALVHPFSRPGGPGASADRATLGPAIGHATFYRSRDAQREYESLPVTTFSTPACPILNLTIQAVDTRYAYTLEVRQTCPASSHPLHPAVFVFAEASGARESRWHYGPPTSSTASQADPALQVAAYRHLHKFSYLAARPVPVHILLISHPHCTSVLSIRTDWWRSLGHSLYYAVPLLFSLPFGILCFAVAHVLRQLRRDQWCTTNIIFVESLVHVARCRLPWLAGFLFSTTQLDGAVLHGLFFLDCHVSTLVHAVGNGIRKQWQRLGWAETPHRFVMEGWDDDVLPGCTAEDFEELYGRIQRLSGPDLWLLLGCSVALVLPLCGLIGLAQSVFLRCAAALQRRPQSTDLASAPPLFSTPASSSARTIGCVVLAILSFFRIIHSTACLVALLLLLLSSGTGLPTEQHPGQRRAILIQARILAAVVFTAVLVGLPSFLAYLQHTLQADVLFAVFPTFADSHSLLVTPLCFLGLRVGWQRSTAMLAPAALDAAPPRPPVDWPIPPGAWWLFEGCGLLCCTCMSLAPHRITYLLATVALALCLWPATPNHAPRGLTPKRTD